MTQHDPQEQRVADALRALADRSGVPDEAAAWDAIRAAAALDRRRSASRRRVGLVVGGIAGAAAAAGLVFLAGGDGGPEAVDVSPAATGTSAPPTTDAEPSTTVLEQEGVPVSLPARPVAVVVDTGGGQRLDLYDADTGALVTRDLASSPHSLGDVSIAADGTVLFTEEFGDSSTVRSVPWDGSGGPATPFDLPDETRSPALSPDGSTLAFVHQGVTTERGRIGLVDVESGAVRYLEWDPLTADEIESGDPDVFRTQASLRGLEWSPDGRRLLFVADYEGPEVLTLDATASSLSEAQAVDTVSADAHWAGPATVVGLRFCCYPDFAEPRVLERVNLLGGDDGTVPPVGEVVAFAIGPDGTTALLRPDGTVDLVAPDGATRPLPVEGPALDVGM